MASDDVRETVFVHFDDYHTKAVQLRGQYLSEYFPPIVRWSKDLCELRGCRNWRGFRSVLCSAAERKRAHGHCEPE